MITTARWVSLIAAFIWGAVAEYHLATGVGADRYTAILLPLVLDVYGFAAMRKGRTFHVVGAMLGMFGTQMVSHLLTLGQAPGYRVALTIGVSAIPPAVSLACHRLGENDNSGDTVDTETATEATPVDTVPVAAYTPATETVDVVDAAVAAPAPLPSTPAREEMTLVIAEAHGADVIDTEGWSKRELAVKGAELIANGATKTEAATKLGITRQWLHACMKSESVTV
jgi:hypothetical protein